MSQIIIPKRPQEAKKLAEMAKKSLVRKVYHGIYTNDMQVPLEQLVPTKWLNIVPSIVSKGIVSFRTAYELKPIIFTNNLQIIFITSTYNKTIKLPGLIIKVIQGDVSNFTEQLTMNLFKSNEARMLLENLTVVRKKEYLGIKTCGPQVIEKYLAKKLNLYTEDTLKQIINDAEQVAKALNLQKEFDQLAKIVGALLATKDIDTLSTSYAKAVAKQQPYDIDRVDLLQNLSIFLNKCNFIDRQYTYDSKSFKNLSFFEAYFSNYIEGTEFIIDEAEDIVFARKEIYNRHADSHDVLANYTLTNNYIEIGETPSNAEDFIGILQARHAILMQARPDKLPGEFKQRINQAGNTIFVAPKDVIGTLSQGFKIYQLIKNNFAKALFMHFLISEVHPFTDGNGRLARIMMSSELVQASLFKIIVPTVCRDNYLNGLRLLTRDQNFYTYCKIIDQLQAYTASIDWHDYLAARTKLEQNQADSLPDDGLPIFYRALKRLKFSDIAAVP